ncbi:MAG: invasion associated locus B family protein [Oricola sp.]
MFKSAKVFAGMLAAGAMAIGAASAQAQTPTRIGEFNDWGSFSYDSGGGKVCYALSVPTAKQPANVDHGDNFFLVTQRARQNVTYEPQFMAGYTLQEGSKVTVVIDGQSFTLFTKENSAWVENAAQEPALVAAMKAGSRMSVKAKSRRGTDTSYEYSLSGVTAALNAIQNCN